ncbi:MAG: hypothetical protein WBD22_10835 [Pyrinomonadaceae bacterium]
MARISEQEFERIHSGILHDREDIIRHNPIGTREETLLWMLLSCLISYLSLSELETPCFPGKPTAETYRNAIESILLKQRSEAFDAGKYLDMFARI